MSALPGCGDPDTGDENSLGGLSSGGKCRHAGSSPARRTFPLARRRTGSSRGHSDKGLYIAQVGPHVPKKVPSGLIHDWLGVGFVPNVRIEDILFVVRDYDRYKDVYRPGVLDSISHGTDGVKDLFSMRLVNKSVVPKTALDQSLREFPTMEPESKGLTRNRKPCLPI